MRLPCRVLLSALMLLFTGAALAAPRAGCQQTSLKDLRTLSPDGFAIYSSIGDKTFFLSWITCQDMQLDLSTAVHESVHHLTADRDAYPLINGTSVARPHEGSEFFPPSVIAARFAGDDDLVATYLRDGQASSAADFLYLLDELNAYSHDLHTAVALESLRPRNEQVDHRDGLAGLMAFLATYVETAEEKYPATWAGLRKPAVARVVATLWQQAETVMASSCGIPEFGSNDRSYIRRFCSARPQASLRKILGRAPVCPTRCLIDEQTASRDRD